MPKILLLFTAVDWPMYMRRPAVYALANAARKYDMTVVAVNRPLCPFTTAVTKRARVPELLGRARLEKLDDNLYLYSPKYLLHDRLAHLLPGMEQVNIRLLRRSYRALQRRLGIHEPHPLIWFNYPQQGYVSDICKESFTIMELYDNLVDTSGEELPAVAEIERNIRPRVDLLLTTSRKLQEKYGGGYRRSYLFGNGLSRSTFQRLCDSSTKPRPEIMAVPSPRVGYAGVISERLDVALITTMARKHLNWHFVFVGPITNTAIEHKLLEHTNIHLFKPVQQSEMPSVLRSFDVGFMPYLDNAFFHFLNPLKFYELAAAGLPSVSSNIEELRQFPEELVAVLPNNADTWCEAIDKTLNSDRERVRRTGEKAAADFIWEDMTAKLLDNIANQYPHFAQDRISSNSL